MIKYFRVYYDNSVLNQSFDLGLGFNTKEDAFNLMKNENGEYFNKRFKGVIPIDLNKIQTELEEDPDWI